MKRLLIAGAVVAVALAAGIAIALAATGGGGNSNSQGAPASNAGSATVSARQVNGAGEVLVDSTGHTLYANDQEIGRMVLCDGACLSFWTPLTVSGGHTPTGKSLTGKLGVATRPNGGKQVTYNGKLLYTFYLDKPGDVRGDGFDDAFGGQQFTWHVVHADNTASSSNSGRPGERGYPGY
jgi:predicted lipoprotein with Yx(FWY)xxD motif